MNDAHWDVGEPVVRREILKGHPWAAFPTRVVQDTDDLLAVYLAPGSELGYADWPFDRWVHPWRTAGHRVWHGHGKLMLHRPGDHYSVDVFWTGPTREFAGWYINLQDPFRRHDGGFDTLDHELDYWLPASGDWEVKDAELFEERIREERYSPGQVTRIRETSDLIVDLLRSGRHWWDPAWAEWLPPDGWDGLDLPPGWQTAPAG